MAFLYLIAIAWIYVVLLMSLAESSLIAGIMTFIFYCVIPLSLVLYILSSPARKRQIKEREKAQIKERQQSTQHDDTTQTKSS
jgi:membrane protein implicated in regulation of membrane protease activity